MVDAYADDSRLADVELENKTITWMAHYDINPTEGKVKSPAMQLFETKYGGTIEWHQTTWENRYTDLASAVLSNESPDFFPADDGDAFPRGAISPMFQPIDDIIDLDSELWAGSKELCDQFVFRDSHYVAAIEATPTYACVYNKTTIEANGFEDRSSLDTDISSTGGCPPLVDIIIFSRQSLALSHLPITSSLESSPSSSHEQ